MYDSAGASTTRSTQPEGRRSPNAPYAPNAPSPELPSRPNRNETTGASASRPPRRQQNVECLFVFSGDAPAITLSASHSCRSAPTYGDMLWRISPGGSRGGLDDLRGDER